MKRIVFAILAFFTIALTACTSPLTGILPSATQESNELTKTQLAVGTLKLEGTEQDITVEQAKELLVLWYVYGDLSQSDIAAQEEMDGLIAQIQENMTTEQIQAITDMKISQQDVSSVAQGNALTTDSSNNNSSATASVDEGGGNPPDGGMTGGMDMPADMGGTGSTVNVSQQTATNADMSTEVPSTVVETLIKFLEKKVM